ncbi:MAG: HD domain-containing protein [Solirubrobacterales bacterium]|nr:HD domain-containing protein [Solirubrobacterales bacterium]MCB0862628.1 HD domain-containing protein [Solirubrobacterales bacterium]MCB8914395.1 HD domain-containing protein [Thermoleophilales bacterium]
MEAGTRNGTPVVELTPGQSFTGRYACARKDRLTAKNGSAYLALELRDRTGSIPARIFRDADRIGIGFERGDVVAVKGRVEQFRGQLSAEIEDVRKIDAAEIDPADFLPTAYRDRDELEGFLEHLAREVHHPGYRAVVEDLLFTGDSAEGFRLAPCTRGGHHAYIGGLSEHTVAVGTLVTETCVLHPKLNSDLLMAAALIHDIGKTGEFTYGAEIGLSDRGRRLGHLQIGAELITAAGERAGLEQLESDALLSTVMCHHGTDALRLRHFPSAEAIALYRLNALDAQVKTALEHGLT